MTVTNDKSLKHEDLISKVRYEPETGNFIARKFLSTRCREGEIMGNDSGHKGYVVIGLNRTGYYAHILAWFYMTGSWPDKTVDHKDRVRSNNRWDNLRLATVPEQNWNLTKRTGTKSKFIGVSSWADGRGWYAQITVLGKRFYLGTYQTEEEASSAYLIAKSKMHVHGSN